MDRAQIRAWLDEAGAVRNRDVLSQILANAAGLAGDDADRLDLKITRDALAEMREAFSVFAPYAGVRKATIFGSARTLATDPLYRQARDVAEAIASAGWMVVTGAGPGIMEAGLEGAGRDNAFGITIRLPFEEGVSDVLAGDDKVVAMKYFFTRKLMLIKESSGFVCLPGGFGTQDETFELLTLQQTGKATPTPVVLLDVDGGTYWHRWRDFVVDEVAGAGLISAGDTDLFLVTDDPDEAVAEVRSFWRNYHSLRWVGDRLVIRLRATPAEHEVAELNESFADLLTKGRFATTDALAAEVSSDDVVDLPRIVAHYNQRKAGRLRAVINACNRFASAPPLA